MSQYYAQYLLSSSGWLLNTKTLKKKKWSHSGYTISINATPVTIPAELVRFIMRRRIAMFIHDNDPFGFQIKVNQLHSHVMSLGHTVLDEAFLPYGHVYKNMLYLPHGAFGLQGNRFYQSKAKVYIDPFSANQYRVSPVYSKAFNEISSAQDIWLHHSALYSNIELTDEGRVIYPKMVIVHNNKRYHLDPGGILLLDDEDYPAGMLLGIKTPLGIRVTFYDYTIPENEILFDRDIYKGDIVTSKEKITVPSSVFEIAR